MVWGMYGGIWTSGRYPLPVHFRCVLIRHGSVYFGATPTPKILTAVSVGCMHEGEEAGRGKDSVYSGGLSGGGILITYKRGLCCFGKFHA